MTRLNSEKHFFPRDIFRSSNTSRLFDSVSDAGKFVAENFDKKL